MLFYLFSKVAAHPYPPIWFGGSKPGSPAHF